MSSISSLELFLSHLLLNPALLYLKILRVLRQTYKWDQKNQSIQIRQPIRDILIKEITMLFNWVSIFVPILKPQVAYHMHTEDSVLPSNYNISVLDQYMPPHKISIIA